MAEIPWALVLYLFGVAYAYAAEIDNNREPLLDEWVGIVLRTIGWPIYGAYCLCKVLYEEFTEGR